MHPSAHRHFRATATLGAITVACAAFTIAAITAKQDGIAVSSAIIGCIFGIGFWFRWTASIAEITIIDLLQDGGWWHGLDLIKRSDGVLQLGTVYVHLNSLENQGLIRSRLPRLTESAVQFPPEANVPSKCRRRLYALAINRPPLAAGKDTA